MDVRTPGTGRVAGSSEWRRIPWWAWALLAGGCLGPVLAVLAISVAFYHQTRNQIGEQAGASKCMANIKQYTRGIGLYSADNDDYLPYAAGWMDACAAYGVDPRGLRCPVAVASNASAFGYAFDIGLSHMNVDRITDTSREIDIYDSDLEQRNATDVGTSLPMRGRHQDRNYIGFVDGHVGYMYSGARMIERPASGQNRNSTDSNRTQ